MTNNPTTYRLPAEWEPNEAVLLSWPHHHTDWAYMLTEVAHCFTEIAKAASRYAKLLIVAPDISLVANTLKGYVDTGRLLMAEMPTNDTWARDFGMLCTLDGNGNIKAHDYKFNGWGLKFASDKDNLITSRLMKSGIIRDTAKYVNNLNFVLEGGSIDTDGRGTLLTTSECLLSPNRNGASSREEIELELKTDFGMEQVLWLEYGALEGDDTDSHIDTLARFIPGGKIVYSSCDRATDSHYSELKQMEREIQALTDTSGQNYETLPLPIPEPIYDEDGQRLPATYANFLIINKAVLLPVYDDDKYDKIAIETMKAAMPHHEIVPINCLALIRQHGSLHCVTMQLPKGVLI